MGLSPTLHLSMLTMFLFLKTYVFPTRSFKRYLWNMYFGFVNRSEQQLQELLVLYN